MNISLANSETDGVGGTASVVAAEDGQVHHLKPITIRTVAGAAAQQCLDDLRPDDKVVRIVRRAGALLQLPFLKTNHFTV